MTALRTVSRELLQSNAIDPLAAAGSSSIVYEAPGEFNRYDTYIAELWHFIECIENERPADILLTDGRRALEIATLAILVVESRQVSL